METKYFFVKKRYERKEDHSKPGDWLVLYQGNDEAEATRVAERQMSAQLVQIEHNEETGLVGITNRDYRGGKHNGFQYLGTNDKGPGGPLTNLMTGWTLDPHSTYRHLNWQEMRALFTPEETEYLNSLERRVQPAA